jgi:hypothetical protein
LKELIDNMQDKKFTLENVVVIEHNGKADMEYREGGRIYNRHELPMFSIIQQTEQHSNTTTLQHYSTYTTITLTPITQQHKTK